MATALNSAELTAKKDPHAVAKAEDSSSLEAAPSNPRNARSVSAARLSFMAGLPYGALRIREVSLRVGPKGWFNEARGKDGRGRGTSTVTLADGHAWLKNRSSRLTASCGGGRSQGVLTGLNLSQDQRCSSDRHRKEEEAEQDEGSLRLAQVSTSCKQRHDNAAL
ncbi:hypothetical protein AAFF_G00400820 [Aldrovandia affinis]|uniref:Uncharacterized protein n=1 Tax=Aldrovandia affinis TaxID=143900 RepID=A0AAD7SCU4_9TELE|nr:hypothetical protein AAFF_G00400820 [Aldrovandia affinis]